MNIASAQYVSDAGLGNPYGIAATIDGRAMLVPLAAENRHYQAILDAVDAGTLEIEE